MKGAKLDSSLMAELFSERARLRERLLSGVLWTVLVAFGFASPWAIFRDTPTIATVFVFGLSLLAVLAMAVLRQVPFQVRLSVLMTCLYAAATTAIMTRGYQPNAFLALGVMVVLATLVAGRRLGFVIVGLTASTLATVTLLQHWGFDYRTPDWATYADSSRVVVMVRVTTTFVLVGIIFVVAISYVVVRGEQLAEQQLHSVAALRTEQAEKARVMADLVQRETALETLNRTLEQRVEERTASLQEVNASLSREMQVRLKREVELRQAQKLESIGRLAAGLAHELNTPLQFISDSVHFVRDSQIELSALVGQYRAALNAVANGEPPAPAVDAIRQHEERCDLTYLEENVPAALAECIDGLQRVARVVQTLKEFAHPEHQSMVPTDLNQAIQNTLMIAHHEYGNIAELVTEFSELPPVLCYPGDINQAVLNVIVNAAHAIAEQDPDVRRPGRISVRTRREGNQVVVSVSDTGAGIPEAVRERVYDPFFTTKSVGRGTGQGLTITRSVIRDKHGGDVSFETTLGQGTTFHLRIPIDGQRSVDRAS